MEINKYFVISLFAAYTFIGYIPAFMIKYAPLVYTSELEGKVDYFINNLVHNWGVKLIIAFIIATILSAITGRRGKAKS